MNRQNERIEENIRRSAAEMKPPYTESLWETRIEKAEGDEWYLDNTVTQKKNFRFPLMTLAAAAAVLLLCAIPYYSLFLRTYATVYVDLNPSISLSINSRERVTSVKANNKDGETVLQDLDLKNTDINTAVNALLGSLIRHGYIDEAHNMLLLSLECENREYGNILKERLSKDMNAYLDTYVGKGIVLKQEVESDDDLEDFAEDYGITIGKAKIVLSALLDHPEWNAQELAGMPISDLARFLHANGIDLKPYSEEAEEYLDSLDDHDDDPDDNDDHYDKDDKDDDDIPFEADSPDDRDDDSDDDGWYDIDDDDYDDDND